MSDFLSLKQIMVGAHEKEIHQRIYFGCTSRGGAAYTAEGIEVLQEYAVI
jgi:hypothetical protein